MSHDLKLERTAPAWTRGMEVTCWEQDGGTRMTIKQGELIPAGVRADFAGGWASVPGGLGRAVAARVTDRS